MDTKSIIEEAKRVIGEEIKSLNEAMARLDESFAKAVDMINQSNRVVVSGVGKSGLIAKKIAATFSSIGVSSSFLDPVDALHGDIGMVQEGDVAILLSKSGSTEEISRLVPYLKMRKTLIIGLVGNLQSYIGRSSDVVLDASVRREACPFNLAPTSSTTVALAIGDALAIALMKVREISIDDFSRLHPLGQIGKNISLKVSDVMQSGDALPIISIDARFKDALMEISNKRLGCVCVLDENMELKGLITDGDVRRVLQKDIDFSEVVLSDIMTINPITILPDAYLNEALSIMENRESQISVLPVTEGRQCVGIIRIHDIIRSGI
jgi:arabinose-5-phosphate isomerase